MSSTQSKTDLAWRRLHGANGHEVGLALLEQLYRARTGQALPPIRRGTWGKPYLEGQPLHFSISHTKDHAFCVLSDVPVGIDAEEMDRPIHLGLADKILSPAEWPRFEEAPDGRQALLRLWVLKEAAAKLSGRGLQGYPNHTDFSPEDPCIRQIDGCYVAILKENEKEQENAV